MRQRGSNDPHGAGAVQDVSLWVLGFSDSAITSTRRKHKTSPSPSAGMLHVASDDQSSMAGSDDQEVSGQKKEWICHHSRPRKCVSATKCA
mmetsp:Transcript_26792/g.62261  ORF Transcript_26792/g.62261 Transcript_26792/m.62261 type:complete len:91 (+) Transcript_26792:738-1010(+)